MPNTVNESNRKLFKITCPGRPASGCVSSEGFVQSNFVILIRVNSTDIHGYEYGC